VLKEIPFRAQRYFAVMRYEQSLIWAAFFGLLVTGCKKEPVDEPPHISITSPTENYSFNVPDTLLITLAVSDDHEVTQVTVGLLNADNIPVVTGVSAVPANGQGSVTLALPVLSQQLESGPYKILATASDGNNSARQLLPVQLNGMPLRLRAVFTVTEQSSNSVALYRTDSLGQTTLATTWPMDFGGAAISSSAQQLYVAGGVSGAFQALDADNLATVWQVPNQSSIGFPWFTSVDVGADGRVLLGTQDGTLRGLNAENGIGGAVGNLPIGFHAVQSITTGNFIISVIENTITQEKRLGTFFSSSGALAESQVLTIDPVVVLPRDEQHVLLYGSIAGQGVVQDRTVSGGSYWEPYTWSAPVIAAARISSDVWAVALQNGELHRFSYAGASSMQIAAGLQIQQMAFDEVNGVLYVGSVNLLQAINPQTGAILAAWPLSGEVRKVLCLLNR
jgi:hypothetical protein